MKLTGDRLYQAIPCIIAICLGVAMILMAACAGNTGVSSVRTTVSTSVPVSTSTPAASEAPSAASSEPSPAAVDYSALQARINRMLPPYSGSKAVVFVPLQSEGAGVAINADASMLSASMLKLPILACLLDEVASGNISLSDTRTIQEADVAGGAGVGLHAGQNLTIEALAKHMISSSDNTAANTIITLLGEDKINGYAKRLGLSQTVLDHKFMQTSASGENLTSAQDIATVLERIARGTLGNQGLSKLAESFLFAQEDDDAIPRGISGGYTLGHKTGSLDAARHDGGIIYDKDGTAVGVLVVLTQGIDEDAANKLIADVAMVVCEQLQR